MKIKKINVEALAEEDKRYNQVCLIRPFGSKLHRLIHIPDDLVENEEFIEVLNTLCKYYHEKSGIFFFHFEDMDAKQDFGMTLLHMGIPFMMLDPELDSPEVITNLN